MKQNFFLAKIMGKCVNMNAWYENCLKFKFSTENLSLKWPVSLLKSGAL